MTERQRERKRLENKRYYGKTSFLYPRRKWSPEEDKLVLAHTIPDSELSVKIQRSLKAICNRRGRLKAKMLSER